MYVDDLISGIRALMKSDIVEPTNIGSSEYVTIAQLAEAVIIASGKNLKIKYISGPVGVASRNFSNHRIHSVGWRANFTLQQGINIHYAWVREQVEKKYGN